MMNNIHTGTQLPERLHGLGPAELGGVHCPRRAVLPRRRGSDDCGAAGHHYCLRRTQ